MTSQDESSEGFLQRWSRKKIDAEQKKPDAPEPDEAAAPEPAGPAVPAGGAVPPAVATNSEFDLSSLPSLESITAGTDIRAFLNPGIPTDLTRAALRRAWTTDAAIRDFVGLAENAWDFNDPTAMPGFGPLDPGYDIKRAVAQMFGELEKPTGDATAEEQPATAQPAHLPEKHALSGASEATPRVKANVESDPSAIRDDEAQSPAGDFVHSNNNTASHKSNDQTATVEHMPRRNHGGALPQ